MKESKLEGYRGNKQLKLPNTVEHISQEELQFRISELQKIANDIKYFAEKYFYIISLDHGKCIIKLYPKQEELIRTMATKKRVICLSCRQSGKCVCDQSLITIRNKQTLKKEKITISEFFNRIKNIQHD